MKDLTRQHPLQFWSILKSALLVAFAVLFAGCSTPATFERMTPDSFDISKQHPDTVNIRVTGGQETDAMSKPQISNEAFAQALIDSVTKSRVFSKVIIDHGADYLLTVNLFSLEQPSFGASFTVNMETGWTLKRAGTTIWQEAIRSEYTAPFSDAFVAVTRLRLATEGAARKNIADGMARISRLNLTESSGGSSANH